MMRKIILFAAFVCFAALNANAQTEEPESKIEKMLRLTKTANENPMDWKAQLEAGHFLLNKENGVYNQSQAEKYIMLSRGDWNIEKPLVGYMQAEPGSLMVVYGEDGRVYDDKHGYMEYGFNYFKSGVVPKENLNMRLITVTPERRQQMIEAYRNYLKKAKKNK